jgi:hypothetical protein
MLLYPIFLYEISYHIEMAPTIFLKRGGSTLLYFPKKRWLKIYERCGRGEIKGFTCSKTWQQTLNSTLSFLNKKCSEKLRTSIIRDHSLFIFHCENELRPAVLKCLLPVIWLQSQTTRVVICLQMTKIVALLRYKRWIWMCVPWYQIVGLHMFCDINMINIKRGMLRCLTRTRHKEEPVVPVHNYLVPVHNS